MYSANQITAVYINSVTFVCGRWTGVSKIQSFKPSLSIYQSQTNQRYIHVYKPEDLVSKRKTKYIIASYVM